MPRRSAASPRWRRTRSEPQALPPNSSSPETDPNGRRKASVVVPALPRPPLSTCAAAGRFVALERLDIARRGRQLWEAIGVDQTRWDGIPAGPFADEPPFLAWLDGAAERANSVVYAIVDRATDRAEGVFFVFNIDPAHGRAELGLFYGPALARRPGGTEAFALIAGYILGTQAYRRLEWRCDDDNAPSHRAAVRYGFTREGVLRQHGWRKGRSRDLALYAMLDGEWPAISARLNAWLDPANFAGDGAQLASLDSLG